MSSDINLENLLFPLEKKFLKALFQEVNQHRQHDIHLPLHKKYFNEFNALGHSCISSKIINVVLGLIFLTIS